MIGQDVDVTKLSDAELLALIGQQGPQSSQMAPMGVAVDAPAIQMPQAPIPVQTQQLPDISQPRPEPYQPTVDDRARAVARGVPVLGAAADEANAALAALISPAVEPVLRAAPQGIQSALGYDQRADVGQLPSFKERYDAAMNLQRFKDDRYDQSAPIESGVMRGLGTIGGSVAMLPALAAGSSALPVTAGLIPRMAVAGAEGGAIGGLQGYASGAGGPSDPSRLESALMGSLAGGAVGTAVPAAITGAGALWKGTGQKVVDAVRGARAPVSAPTEAGISAQRLPYGDTAEGRDLAEVLMSRRDVPVTQVPASAEDDAYVRIAQALQRQRQTPEQMASNVSALGPRGMIADTGEAMRDLTNAAVNRPSGAADIARTALDLRQLGKKEGGEFLVRPSSGRILDEAASSLGVDGKAYHGEADNLITMRKAQAAPAYAKAYEAPPVDIGEMRDFAGSKLFKDAYQRARSISEKEFVTLPDGSEQIIPLPEAFTSNEALDWRTLDLMKQGLDDLIKEGRVQGIGANEQGAIKGYLKRFVDKLDTLNPDYKAAREAFAGPTAMMDALEAGRSSLREDAPDLAKTLSEMSDSEQQMYRLGALQGLKDKLGNADVTYDAARQAGVLKPNQLERFKELFPSKESFAKFANMLENEQTMFQTRSAILGGSQTARRLANVQDQDEGPFQTLAQGAVDAKTGNVMGLIRALGRIGGPAKLSEPSAEALAAILTNMDQSSLPMVTQRLTEAQKRQMLIDTLRQSSAAGGASTAAGSVGGKP